MNSRCLQNVADVFVEQLSAWGVRFVYGIPGGSVLPVIDAIRRLGLRSEVSLREGGRDDIRFILVRHESTAAYMASAYAKINDDGTLGDWKATTPLPSVRWGHVALKNGINVYVIGGSTSSVKSPVVLYAQFQ